MTSQKLSLFQTHYGRRANAIQSLQLSLPLSVIIVYLAAKQYSCVTWYINCTTLSAPPRESLFVPSTPDLMPKKILIHSLHIKAISALSLVKIYSAAIYWTAEHCTEQPGGCVLDEDLSAFIIFYYLPKQLWFPSSLRANKLASSKQGIRESPDCPLLKN